MMPGNPNCFVRVSEMFPSAMAFYYENVNQCFLLSATAALLLFITIEPLVGQEYYWRAGCRAFSLTHTVIRLALLHYFW